jgi:iron(III) transport system substrate-binding protein
MPGINLSSGTALLRQALAGSLPLLLVLAGCAPAGAPSASAPAQSSGGGPANAASEWDQTVAAARAEGEIIIWGPQGTDIRDAMVNEFQRLYPEIRIDFLGLQSNQVATKLIPERQAGMFRADLIVNGATTIVADLIPAGALDPIGPYLAGPDLRDQSKWLDGKYEFADQTGLYNLVFVSGVKLPIAYNPRSVAPSDLKSYKALLEPRWLGKVAMLDPRSSGAGNATATFFYSHPSLGPSYLRQLFGSNAVVFSKDDRQVMNWVTRDQYPIALAPSESYIQELKSKGLTIEPLDGDLLDENSYLTSGFGTVAVANRAPHPAATKVYLNWLLSREGQSIWTRAHGYPSRRLDAATDHLRDGVIPRAGYPYQKAYDETTILLKDEVAAFLRAEVRD